ncbi:hypothetical protein SAE02_73510 [Skermanella aerolata]|uniref:Uncharacterized protein n=1 Tax=Skermanella aerolata TaxID=393310 RepID=A0A512E397_9PROT|nr:hypothetical protein SAE02_73510 [Skermanella aerolata]
MEANTVYNNQKLRSSQHIFPKGCVREAPSYLQQTSSPSPPTLCYAPLHPKRHFGWIHKPALPCDLTGSE